MFIEILSYISNKESRLKDLREIFDLNAKSPTPELFDKYARPYIENWPDDVFFACDLASKQTMGYLLGCRDSRKGAEILSPLLKSYSVFEDLFPRYPAHFHINVHPRFHGRGAGTFLVQDYLVELKKSGVKGVHIVTSPDERNVDFYLKQKFIYQLARPFNDRNLLFMGTRI